MLELERAYLILNVGRTVVECTPYEPEVVGLDPEGAGIFEQVHCKVAAVLV